ncbi:HNH endonuclease signature motif containing protein [Angustibacter peucedani]
MSAPRHPLATDRYAPTTAITRHVHAAAPTCSAYDCPRTAHRCDLDHDDPWPRGPTSVANLDPKCRKHHQAKTHALVHTHLTTDGPRTVTWTYRSGLQVTTTPDPLPGCP